MKKVHEDTLTEHKKEMERMNAKIAQHSLKVESYKAVAEADQAESNYAKGLIDEQKRILEQLDVNLLIDRKLHDRVECAGVVRLREEGQDVVRELDRPHALEQDLDGDVADVFLPRHLADLVHRVVSVKYHRGGWGGLSLGV